ncbi:endochitinase 3-like [Lycium barbarum]|uniref:endochitinase 3-like n=1 Tax=Lycium barbarum TaxID=112863 RepID=UPI00293E75F0|nr:endochitinase 3-like [Lycium barbarum]
MNMMKMRLSQLCVFATLSVLAILLIPSVLAERCGKQAGGAPCPSGYCCSNYGWCGTTADYCDLDKCQSQRPSPSPPFTPPPPTPSGADITEIITGELFDKLLLRRNDNRCPAKGFYNYDAFVQAARYFPGFATTGDITDRKRELAAFLAQTSHETNGGWPAAEDGPYAWGYCYKRQIGDRTDLPSNCIECAADQWPCAPGKKYYGRGPIQISYNCNYGPCGVAIGENLLGNPDLVENDVVISFKSAIWFWMTPQPPKPSCHDVILGKWVPSQSDITAHRVPGYGVITNIINGGLDCGHGPNERITNGIGYYTTFCKILGVSPGENLDCGDQLPFSQHPLFSSM